MTRGRRPVSRFNRCSASESVSLAGPSRSAPRSAKLRGMMEPQYEVLYEAGPMLAVRKPAGLLTQAPEGIDSLEARIKAWIKYSERKPGGVYLGVPHRLDRPVSGVMVFARHARAARRLSEQFEGRLVKKIYWACVEGIVTPEAGTWIDQVRKVQGEPKAEVVTGDDPEAREAVLHYRVRGTSDNVSWLEVELITGRTHQVRLQASSRGHPVLGDTMYGATRMFGPQYEDERLRAVALHARSLGLRHPMTKDPVTVVAPVSEEWHELGLPLDEPAATN